MIKKFGRGKTREERNRGAEEGGGDEKNWDGRGETEEIDVWGRRSNRSVCSTGMCSECDGEVGERDKV